MVFKQTLIVYQDSVSQPHCQQSISSFNLNDYNKYITGISELMFPSSELEKNKVYVCVFVKL